MDGICAVFDPPEAPVQPAFIGTLDECRRRYPGVDFDDDQHARVMVTDLEYVVCSLLDADDPDVVATYRAATGAQTVERAAVEAYLRDEAHLDFAHWLKLAGLVRSKGIVSEDQYHGLVVQYVTRLAPALQQSDLGAT